MKTISELIKTSVGTPYFMAPEVCQGKPYGMKADIWAIGCILYELAILQKPFDGANIKLVFE